MGIVAEAARTLRSERVGFEPALAAGGGSAWTLRDALVTACGCHRHAGPLAYWQWQEIYDALEAAREAIVSHTTIPQGIQAERWANQPSRTLEEVLAALDAVPTTDDPPVPDELSMRPWCDQKAMATCRIPYIPLAALVHAWGDPARPWSALVAEFDLCPDLSPWDLLRRVDPVIASSAPPAAVRDKAWRLRQWMALQEEVAAPVRWLFDVTKSEPDADLERMEANADEAIAAHQAQQEQEEGV